MKTEASIVFVRLADGTEGEIAEQHGGFFTLESGYKGHWNQVIFIENRPAARGQEQAKGEQLR